MSTFRLGFGQLLMMGRDLNDMSQVIAVTNFDLGNRIHRGRLAFKTIECRLQDKWGLAPAT